MAHLTLYRKILLGLKLYNKTPPNGLILYTGTVLGEDGRTEKKMVIDFEPFKPINKSLYLCDNKFHVQVRILRNKQLEK
ncbi:MAG: hypothetical protein EOP04_21800 [Proteobacteria bacterium]|nr:MAG: hypothetical protein EOP04_21800 [Pseudomonadota bacterium]